MAACDGKTGDEYKECVCAGAKTESEKEVCLSVQSLPNSEQGVTSGNLANVLYWVYGAGGILAVAVIVYGGIKYIMSQGQPDKTKQASQIIAYALVGLFVVSLAGAITAFITSAIGGATK